MTNVVFVVVGGVSGLGAMYNGRNIYLMYEDVSRLFTRFTYIKVLYINFLND